LRSHTSSWGAMTRLRPRWQRLCVTDHTSNLLCAWQRQTMH